MMKLFFLLALSFYLTHALYQMRFSEEIASRLRSDGMSGKSVDALVKIYKDFRSREAQINAGTLRTTINDEVLVYLKQRDALLTSVSGKERKIFWDRVSSRNP
ncbi:hypothetical protein GCK72_012546 [Caenorhabditis remanei]|uniref:Uncharacterized protein n=1 Tax=Caenorhabditis remanei TaxID=31234 RepID=A0A6A5GN66_CAERE|nr:hypothetical protein GCK72_012546 [Caenorhabditis remanei]KAF1756093.1 hypothetical protein GCK72_012546 [Caenorhabditis remanei]